MAKSGLDAVEKGRTPITITPRVLQKGGETCLKKKADIYIYNMENAKFSSFFFKNIALKKQPKINNYRTAAAGKIGKSVL